TQCSRDIGYAADNQPAIVAPREFHIFAIVWALVAGYNTRLKFLIVIDSEYAGWHCRCIQQAPRLRWKISCACVAKCPVSGEAMNVGRAHTSLRAVQFRFGPRNRKRNRSVLKRAEIERIVSELPEVVGVHKNIFADRLLESGVELIAMARRYSRGRAVAQNPCCHAVRQIRSAR